MLLLIDKIIQKLIRSYRKSVFAKKINCPHKDFKLVGKVTLINNNVKIGRNVTIFPDVMIYGDGPINIADNVSIGNGTIIYASHDGGVTIGENTMIAAHTYIIDCDHGIEANIPVLKQKNTVDAVIIGNDVWIAANATILKGSKISDGAVIGAKTLVKGAIPENAIAVGIPAKVIKYRE